jgi:hypothetical protein
MIYLEGIKTRVTMALVLKDELSPDGKTIGDAFIKVSGTRKKPLKHSTGYFFLLDVQGGKCTITTTGKLYKKESFTIDSESLASALSIGTKASSPKLPVAEIKLTRK